MPVTKSRNGIQDMLALDKTNTARFLFGDEDNNGSSDPKSYLHQTEDGFPILLRGEHPQHKVCYITTFDFAVSTDLPRLTEN